MKQRNRLFIAGAIGGLAGALLGELAPRGPEEFNELALVLNVAIWSALIAVPIALALRWAIAMNGGHRWLAVRHAALAMSIGAVAGALSGGAAQYLFNLFEDGVFKDLVARTFCWGIMGGFLGLGLSYGIPNLKKWRGAALGFVGGVAGGAGFLGANHLEIGGMGARSIGGVAIGGLIGLAIAIAEVIEVRKGASLRIIYGPKESVEMALGAVPVTFGDSPSDTVYVRGLGARALSVLARGAVVVAKKGTDPEVTLRNGSSISIGSVSIQVRQS